MTTNSQTQLIQQVGGVLARLKQAGLVVQGVTAAGCADRAAGHGSARSPLPQLNGEKGSADRDQRFVPDSRPR